MRDLVIIGAGGHGRETLDVVEAMNRVCPRWNFKGFLDDSTDFSDRVDRRGTKILGPLDQLLGTQADTHWVGVENTTAAVIAELGERRLALAVDEVLEHEPIVVKAFDAPLGVPAIFSGATLRADGRPLLLLDPLSTG